MDYIDASTAWELEPIGARDLDGRLIRFSKPTEKDLLDEVEITLVHKGERIPFRVKKAALATDSQGTPLRKPNGDSIPRATTIYDAVSACCASRNETNPVPILCHQPHMKPVGVCRVCVVQMEKQTKQGLKPDRKLMPACQHRVEAGLIVYTAESAAAPLDAPVQESELSPEEKKNRANAATIRESIRTLVGLLGVNCIHPEAPGEGQYENELQNLIDRYAVNSSKFVPRRYDPARIDVSDERTTLRRGGSRGGPLNLFRWSSNRSNGGAARGVKGNEPSAPLLQPILVDHNNCILCNRCVRACNDVRPFEIIGRTGKGESARIGFDFDEKMVDSNCVTCGECMISCPTGALTLREIKAPLTSAGPKETSGRVVTAAELKVLELAYADPETKKVRTFRPFQNVPLAFLKWMEGQAVRRTASPGDKDPLCIEGEYGNTAFLLERGSFAVFVGGNNVASVHAGKDLILGEMACLSNQRRTATVRAAAADSSAVEITRNILYVLLRDSEARHVFGRFYAIRALSAFFRELLATGEFLGLDQNLAEDCIRFLQERISAAPQGEVKNRVADRVHLLRVDPNVAICRQGETGKDLYMVRFGHVKVVQHEQARDVVLDYLRPGAVFGEIALMSLLSAEVAMHLPPDQPRGKRTVSCLALDNVELVSIPSDVFQQMCELPGVMAALERICIERLDASLGAQRRYASPQADFIAKGIYQGQRLLVMDLDSCTRCDECTTACVESHADGHNRLTRDGDRFGNFLVATSCRSCHDPKCLVGCPTDAIHRRQKSLAIIIEADKCIGCSLCSENCPFGNIKMTVGEDGGVKGRKATTCDLCQETPAKDPMCVRACPHDAAHRVDAMGFWLATQGKITIREAGALAPGAIQGASLSHPLLPKR